MSDFKSSTIRKLIEKSEGGSFSASYQLSIMYEKGDGISKPDIEKSLYYKDKCSDYMKKSKLRLSEVSINNFRGIKKEVISFRSNSNITVLVGNNGSGKSTVLDAITKSLSHIRSRLATKSTNGDYIETHDITLGENESSVDFEYSIDSVKFNMSLLHSRNINDKDDKNKYRGINELVKLYKAANTANENTSFPLISSYTVERANDVTTKDIEESEEIKSLQIWDKRSAYDKSLSGKADFKIFFRWMKDLLEQNSNSNIETQSIKNSIDSKYEQINSPMMKELLMKDEMHQFAQDWIKKEEEEIDFLRSKLMSVLDEDSKDSKAFYFVKKAIFSFLGDFSNIYLQAKPLDLVLKKNDKELSILQLSQGEKTLLALVADISRRLIILNPSLEDPLDGSGIVLIDEVDLHLHPGWQQKLISNLKNTFKNLQFILTTHSPQVCHTVDSEDIWLLKDGKKYQAPKGVRGGVSSWVLENLFDVEKRPPQDHYTILLSDYTDLVYQNRFDEECAKKYRSELVRHFGTDYKQIVELDLYIENRKWEAEFEKNL